MLWLWVEVDRLTFEAGVDVGHQVLEFEVVVLADCDQESADYKEFAEEQSPDSVLERFVQHELVKVEQNVVDPAEKKDGLVVLKFLVEEFENALAGAGVVFDLVILEDQVGQKVWFLQPFLKCQIEV